MCTVRVPVDKKPQGKQRGDCRHQEDRQKGEAEALQEEDY